MKDFLGDLLGILIIITFVGIVIALIGACVWLSIQEYTGHEVTEITIKDKYVKAGKENGVYLVVTTENYTYKVTDLFFKGKFNSTDIYNNLEIGKTYIVETTGHRIPFFSEYKNINKYTLKEGQDEH